MHIVVCMMHVASLALVLGDRPAGAWSRTSPLMLEPIKWDGRDRAMIVLGAMAVLLGILHVALAVRGSRFIRSTPAAEAR
jgi:hypothetical protein